MPQPNVLPLNKLERAILIEMFEAFAIDLSHIETFYANERTYTGVGVFTEIPKQSALNVPAEFIGDKFLDVHGRLNSNIDVGFIVYIEDQFVNCIEAYTYDRNWPARVSAFELFKLPE